MSRKLYDYDEAAAELRVTKTWLQRHIKKLPHVDGLGGQVFFTDADLDRIIADRHYEPDQAPRPSAGAAGAPALAALRPLPARSRA